MSIVNFTYPKFQSIDPVSGNPRVGYKLFTYAEGTSTKKTTWTDISKVSANTNPIILDSNGEASIWLDGNYKFVLAPPTDTDPPTSPVWTVDNVRTPTDPLVQQVTLTAPTNGSFETDTNADGIPDNWVIAPYTNGTVAIDSSSSYHGQHSLKFTSTGSGGGVASTDAYYEVEASYPVRVSFDIISANANTSNTVAITWYNSSKVFISNSNAYSESTANPTSWTRKEFLLTAPATAKYAKVVITGVSPASTTHSSTNFDNIVLQPYKLPYGRTITPTSDADYTLTSADALADTLYISTGSWTAGHNIIVDAVSRSWASVVNNTAYDLTVKTLAGTGVKVFAGTSRPLVCDGTNVIDPLSSFVVTGKKQIITADTTWTAPVTASYLITRKGGGGGGGAGAASYNANSAGCGGWGGGSGTVLRDIVTITAGTSKTIVIGTGGTGGASSGLAGNAGTSTTFTGLADAGGGPGGGSTTFGLNPSTVGSAGSNGHGDGGGIGGAAGGVGAAGGNAVGLGSGGGGGGGGGGGTSVAGGAGGNGANGYVIIEIN